ncbi:MAG: polysaccharide biosynthesis/export family protein [Phycisphaerae bacterium]
MPARFTVLTLLVAAAGSGCAATTTHEQLASFLKAHEHAVAGTEMRVGARDTLSITASRILEVDGQQQTVMPDGKISLRLLGEVKVVGLTAREIASKLEELLSPYYHEPEVQVRIVDHRSHVYYVLGQVGAVGAHPFTGRDTLLKVMVRAVPNNIAWTSRVKVIRPSPFEDKRREIEINVKKMLATGDTRMNILLEPGDLVYVPPTPLGWIGLKLQELLFPVGPVLQTAITPAVFAEIDDVYRNGTGVGLRTVP